MRSVTAEVTLGSLFFSLVSQNKSDYSSFIRSIFADTLGCKYFINVLLSARIHTMRFIKAGDNVIVKRQRND